MKNSEIGLKEKIGYGLGDAASSMFWKLFGMYLLFFYTDIFGLPAAVVGTMFLITRIWDAVNDPIFGAIADRTHSRWGKFRPYLLWGALPFGVCGVFLFLTPDWSPGARTVYAYVTYTLMMMVYSFINVPYASLLGVMTSDTVQRTQLSSSRMIFAFVGSILVLAAVDPLRALFDRATSGDTALNWTLTVAVFAVIAILLFLLCFSWTRERVVPIKESDNRLWDDLRDLSRNKPWWILIGAGIGVLICNSIRDGAAIYYFKYYVSRDAAVSLSGASFTLTSVYLVLGQAACIAGILLAAVLSRRFGKKPVFAGAMALATVLSAAFFFLSSTQIAGIMILQVLISTCLGSIFPLLWSMYADTADYSELKTGRRATGLIFSSSSMSQKFGWTIGGTLTGWLLGYYGFQANVEQTAGAIFGIRLMLSVLPAAGTALSLLLILFYPLSEKRMEGVNEQLTQLRKTGNHD